MVLRVPPALQQGLSPDIPILAGGACGASTPRPGLTFPLGHSVPLLSPSPPLMRLNSEQPSIALTPPATSFCSPGCTGAPPARSPRCTLPIEDTLSPRALTLVPPGSCSGRPPVRESHGGCVGGAAERLLRGVGARPVVLGAWLAGGTGFPAARRLRAAARRAARGGAGEAVRLV